MSRAFLFIMDGFGVGHAPDASAFGDEGSNTFGHLWARQKPNIPTLARLGLGGAAALAGGENPFPVQEAIARFGAATETSKGKDTITGHWEIAGVPLAKDWGYFPNTNPAFPAELVQAIISGAKLPGLLCLTHASGTQVIEDFGEECLRTGKPIMYTSADSVIQIAAHEEHFGLQRLYDVCKVARELSFALNIGRVIARPFVGETAKTFTRTGNRKDYSVLPPQPTLLDVLSKAGRDVCAIGKIGDIYAHSGTGREIKVAGMDKLTATTEAEMPKLKDGGFLMVNFVNFDTDFGHRRDPAGYAGLLEEFDRWLGKALHLIGPQDHLFITADHGNDPTFKGTDHTRERIPVLWFNPAQSPGSIGLRGTFSDIGQTIASVLGVGPLGAGKSFG
ncbi:MAG: phosphopentomutase [Alphaproteobacteria bacterium]|nr:phosphopentomutase [Alphaproteobacteria bacterium]